MRFRENNFNIRTFHCLQHRNSGVHDEKFLRKAKLRPARGPAQPLVRSLFRTFAAQEIPIELIRQTQGTGRTRRTNESTKETT